MRLRSPLILFALATASACITVNVNFPESAVKQAADDFVRDLYKDSATASAETGVDSARVPTSDEQSDEAEKPAKKKKGAKPAPNPSTAKPSTADQTFFDLLRAFDPIPAARAEELNMSSPKAKTIKGRMSARLGDILKWKAKGAVGETHDGNLAPRDTGALGKDEKKQLEALIEKENSDRAELYDEIQSVNAITDRKQTRIRRLFGNAFRSNSPAGTWVESESGAWSRK